jgi:hypothetical protein
MSALDTLYAPSPSEMEFGYLTIPMKDDAVIFGGAIVAIVAATGYAVTASNTSGLLVAGKAFVRGAYKVDNTNGGDGGKRITVRFSLGKIAYIYDNSTGSPLVQASFLDDCYVEDDHTVAVSASNSIVAGKFLGFPLDNAGNPITSKALVLFAR